MALLKCGNAVFGYENESQSLKLILKRYILEHSSLLSLSAFSHSFSEANMASILGNSMCVCVCLVGKMENRIRGM